VLETLATFWYLRLFCYYVGSPDQRSSGKKAFGGNWRSSVWFAGSYLPPISIF